MTRRPLVLVAVTLAVAAVAAVVVVHRMHRVSVLTRAERVLREDKRFPNGPKSGRVFADLSHDLLGDAQSCSNTHGRDDTRCRARFSAAAYANVTAAAVLNCTQPGIYDARRSTSQYLRSIAAHDRAPTRPAPSVPRVVTC